MPPSTGYKFSHWSPRKGHIISLLIQLPVRWKLEFDPFVWDRTVHWGCFVSLLVYRRGRHQHQPYLVLQPSVYKQRWRRRVSQGRSRAWRRRCRGSKGYVEATSHPENKRQIYIRNNKDNPKINVPIRKLILNDKMLI